MAKKRGRPRKNLNQTQQVTAEHSTLPTATEQPQRTKGHSILLGKLIVQVASAPSGSPTTSVPDPENQDGDGDSEAEEVGWGNGAGNSEAGGSGAG